MSTRGSGSRPSRPRTRVSSVCACPSARTSRPCRCRRGRRVRGSALSKVSTLVVFGLRDVARAVDLVVDHDQHAAPARAGLAAAATALYRLAGPSALIAVAGRIEPTSTTGLSLLTTRFRKYAVSSMVSVPWVITTPSTSGWREQLVRALGELEPDLVVHVLAADVRDLLAAELGDLVELRHRLDQVLDLEAGPTCSRTQSCLPGSGDRAAGGEDHDGWLDLGFGLLVLLGEARCREQASCGKHRKADASHEATARTKFDEHGGSCASKKLQ